MSRTRIVWVLIPMLTLLFVGCPKKAPKEPPQEIQMDTQEVTPPPTTEMTPPTPPMEDSQEVDPLDSDDLRLVNEELQRQGFSPNVYFEFDQSDLSEETRSALQRNAQFLKQHPDFQLTVEGHCDERGTNEYNLALGDRRANTVKSYLGTLGIDGSRLRTISYGEERPVCTESDELCWAQNRRAYMVVTGRAS